MVYYYPCFRWRIRDRSRSGISQALKSILQSSTSTQPSFPRFLHAGFYVIGGSQSLRRRTSRLPLWQHPYKYFIRKCRTLQDSFQKEKSFLEKRQESYENILSETGIRYRMNRSIQVEGAFGVLKNDYGFQRFLLRGKTKVKLEILLLCIGYNINKLHAKIQKERTGSHLFAVKGTA